MAQRFNRFSLLLVFLLAGCNRYEVTFNQQPIHTPAKLLTGYEIADPALRSCVAQTIQDQQISRIDALKRLLCTNAGIGSLKGLEAFVGLEILNLANNALSTIEPLHTLPSLAQLDLSANPGLKCNEIDALTARGVTTTIPEHCKLGSTK
ncbi:MAG TPA: leucine-rich repeat domain-containing protein [Porticoccaceae bacterium]|nr:leucine-rich repeat domain-containing protein [Porticoccaceae bacterium]